jgi:beta-phosphoglucomutase-like phosphatase (HAD superfamily)
MFDIDGTLVDSTGFDGRIYAETADDVLGIAVDRDWSTYPHVTDGGLLDEIMLRHGIADPDGTRHAAVKREFISRIGAYIQGEPQSVREIAGATALLASLRLRSDCRVAIATGGWRETARLKLRAAGFDPDGVALASSCDAHRRTDIMEMAARRAMEGEEPRRRTYFGDGAWDRRACAELGWDFVAIGGGVPHPVAFDGFADRDAILACLGLAPP